MNEPVNWFIIGMGDRLPAMVSYIKGSVKDCNNSSALAVELLQSCTDTFNILFITG